MEKLEGHKFKLNKGDYIKFQKTKITFEDMLTTYIGIVRNYDGVRAKSGCVSKVYKIYHLSGKIKELFSPHIFAWYEGGFLGLGDFENRDFGVESYYDLYKMDEKEIQQFKTRITKTKILLKLK